MAVVVAASKKRSTKIKRGLKKTTQRSAVKALNSNISSFAKQNALFGFNAAIAFSRKNNMVDIYIRERNGTQNIRIPWLPASIEYESGGVVVASYDIMNRGPVDVPTASGLAKISFESQFPGGKRTDKSMLRGTWKSPETYHKILDKWATKGTALNILVTGYPINKDVYLSSYSCTPAGGFGDMEYSVEFTEQRDITVSSTKVKNKDKNAKKKRNSKTKTTYKIKKGDTLWKIAKKYMGAGSKWKKIYTANKSIIEKTAKKRGYKSSNNGKRLFAGTKITIPKS